MKNICFIVSAGIVLAGVSLAEEESKEPEQYYVLEVQDCFQAPLVSVATPEELKAAQQEVSKRNMAISLAHRKTVKSWSEMEKERVDLIREENKKRKKGAPLVRAFKKPFLLKEPGLISVRGDGPYEDLDEAVQKAEAREKAVQHELEFKTTSEERKIEQMSEQSRKSYEEQKELIEKQKEMFLSALDSMAGKSSLLACGGNVKRMGGKITRLVKNTRRMMKPGAKEATATKVDQRAVQN